MYGWELRRNKSGAVKSGDLSGQSIVPNLDMGIFIVRFHFCPWGDLEEKVYANKPRNI